MTTQRINLYTAEFRPRRQYLSLSMLALACGALLGIGALIGGLQWWHGAHLHADLQQVTQQLQNTRNQLEADKARLALHVPSPELQRQQQKLADEVDAKVHLVQALKATPPSVRDGYGSLLEALARHPLDGLWLSRIDIVGDAVNLSGFARKADLVPEYIETLMRDEQFNAQTYQVLTMQATDDGLFAFDLRNRAGQRGTP